MEIMEVEDDDDLLFAELNRRISLLIMDDNELPIGRSNLTRPADPVQAGQSPLMAYFKHSVVRESKGTGVFIPARLPQPRRKQRHAGGFRTKPENKRLNSRPSSTYYIKTKRG